MYHRGAAAILILIIIALTGALSYMFGKQNQSINPTPSPITSTVANCITAGCSATLCVDEDKYNDNPLFTTCEYKKSYGCYKKHSTCKRQDDGECGWTRNEAFEACLKTNN